MQRRKFVIGAGALASGAAAAVGTGAFTSVNADRSVDVNVAGDASAYLALEEVEDSTNSDYVDTSNGEVSLDFSSSGDPDGNGFNPDAVTEVNDLLRVTNQGTQDVNFSIDLNDFKAGNNYVTFSTGDQDGEDDLVANPITLTPGDSIDIDLEVDMTDQGPVGPFDGSITFVAEAN